jgi:hypothetical protein
MHSQPDDITGRRQPVAKRRQRDATRMPGRSLIDAGEARLGVSTGAASPPSSQALTTTARILAQEAAAYLGAVDAFRAAGCRVRWAPEPIVPGAR